MNANRPWLSWCAATVAYSLAIAIAGHATAFAQTIVIVSHSPGLAAEEVESMVTHPIEVTVRGVAQVQSARSASWMGRSVVWVDLERRGDIHTQRQRVVERLQLVKDRLPDKTQPTLIPPVAQEGSITLVAIQAVVAAEKAEEQSTDAVKMRAIGEWVVRPRLLAIPGVANVTLTGGRCQQSQVIVSPERLAKFNVALGDVITAAEKAAATTAGTGTKLGGDRPVRVVVKPLTPDDIAHTVLAVRAGVPVFIKDVADVRRSAAMADSEASVWTNAQGKTHGGSAVVLAVHRNFDANNKRLDERLEKVLAETQSELPADVRVVHETFRDGDITLSVRSVEPDFLKNTRVAKHVENVLLRVPGVAAVWRTTGPAEIGGEDQLGDASVFMIRLSKKNGAGPADKSEQGPGEVAQAIRRQLGEIPGVKATLARPSSVRHSWAGVEGDFAVKVLGDDLETLRRIAEQIQSRLSLIAGIVDLQTQPPGNAEQLHMEIDREAAARLGVGLDEVADVIRASGRGRSAGHIREESRRIELVVRYENGTGTSPEALGKTRLRTATGEFVPLSRVVRTSIASGPTVIYREDGKRAMIVSYNIHGRSEADVRREALKEIASMKATLPSGYLVLFARF